MPGQYAEQGPILMPVYPAMDQGSSNYKVDVSLKVELLDGTRVSKSFRAVIGTGAAPVIVRRGGVGRYATASATV
jgi:hypothetical protein